MNVAPALLLLAACGADVITPATRLPVWVLAGQSNVTLRCDTADTGGDEFDYLYPGSTWYRDIRLSGGTMQDQVLSFGRMAPSASRKFGIERPLRERFAAHMISVAEGATKLSRDWLPPDDYMYARLVARIDDALSQLGRTEIDGLIWFQGTNDAADEAAADAYAANLGTLFTALRALYGTFKIVLVLIHAENPGAFRATVRTQQATYVASDANCVSVDPDAYESDGGAHYTTAGYVDVARAIHAAIVGEGWHLTVGS